MRSPGAAFDLRASMTQELNAALEELESCERGAKALHQCRVRLKKARSLGRLGQAVAPGLAAVFNDTAQVVMRQLGQARDLAALADTARMLADKADRKRAPALIEIGNALQSAHERSPQLDIDGVRAGIRDLVALAQVWPAPSSRQIRSGAARLAKRARRARRRGCGAVEDQLRHIWRKREQSRLFAAMLLGRAWSGVRQRKKSHALTHLLGLERDARLLLERIEHGAALGHDSDASRRVKRTLRKYRARLRKRADKLGARLQAAGA